MGRKKKEVKEEEKFELNIPEDFNGEVSATVSNGSGDGIAPITQDFGNGELNVLKDKINEIIAQR